MEEGRSSLFEQKKVKSLSKRFTCHEDSLEYLDNEEPADGFYVETCICVNFSRLGSDMSTKQKEKSLECPRLWDNITVWLWEVTTV